MSRGSRRETDTQEEPRKPVLAGPGGHPAKPVARAPVAPPTMPKLARPKPVPPKPVGPPTMPNLARPRRKWDPRVAARNKWQSWVCLILIIGLFACGVWAASSDTLVTSKPSYHLTNWLFLFVTATLAASALLVGWTVRGIWSGVLIDPKRLRMSLSRLQLILWTVLVLSAYITAVMINLAQKNRTGAGAIDALNVAIPGELLVVMGLTVGTAVTTKIVLNQKDVNHGISTEAEPRGPGAVYQAERPQWRDLFEGDTEGSKDTVDIGKFQMFYITVALLIGYGLVVADMFATVPGTSTLPITSLPALNEGFIALLAISHAGYVTTKVTS